MAVTVPLLKGHTIDIGDGLEGFDGGTFDDAFLSINEPLEYDDVDFSVTANLTIDNPVPGSFDPIDFPVGDLQDEANIPHIADIVEATIDRWATGTVTINFIDLQASEDGVEIFLRNASDDSVIVSGTLQPDENSVVLDMAEKTVFPEMYLDATGDLEFVDGAAQGQIIVETNGDFPVSKVILTSEHLERRFGPINIGVSERFELPEDVIIESIYPEIAIALDFVDWDASNLEILLDIDVVAYDENGGEIKREGVSQGFTDGVEQTLNDLADTITEFITRPDVYEIEIVVKEATLQAIDLSENVTIELENDPRIEAEASISLGGVGQGVDLQFSIEITREEEVPDEVEGGALVVAIDNDSSLNGRLNLWITDRDSPPVPGTTAPTATLDLSAESSGSLEVTVTQDLLDLLRTHEELLVTVALTGFGTTEAVQAGDTITIDARALFAGRVNKQ